MDNHIEEAKRLGMEAVKAEHSQRGIQETARGLISGLVLPDIDLGIKRPIHQLLAHFFAWSNVEGNIYLSSSICNVITTLTSTISNYNLTEIVSF